MIENVKVAPESQTWDFLLGHAFGEANVVCAMLHEDIMDYEGRREPGYVILCMTRSATADRIFEAMDKPSIQDNTVRMPEGDLFFLCLIPLDGLLEIIREIPGPKARGELEELLEDIAGNELAAVVYVGFHGEVSFLGVPGDPTSSAGTQCLAAIPEDWFETRYPAGVPVIHHTNGQFH